MVGGSCFPPDGEHRSSKRPLMLWVVFLTSVELCVRGRLLGLAAGSGYSGCWCDVDVEGERFGVGVIVPGVALESERDG